MDQYFFEVIRTLAGKSDLLDSLIVFSAEYLGYVIVVLLLGYVALNKNWKLLLVAVSSAILSRGIIT